MKKTKFTLLWAALGIGTAGVLLWGMLTFLWMEQGISLWIAGISSREIAFTILYLAAVTVLILFSVWLCARFPKWQIPLAMLMILVLLLGSMVSFFHFVFNVAADSYEVYTSPDGQHTVIIRCQSWIFNTWGTFYERTSPLTMQEVGTYELDDAYPNPFTILWDEDSFTVSYCGESQTLSYAK